MFLNTWYSALNEKKLAVLDLITRKNASRISKTSPLNYNIFITFIAIVKLMKNDVRKKLRMTNRILQL